MINVTELYPKEKSASYLGPAKVIESAEYEGIVRVRLTTHQEESEASARIAVPSINSLVEGDEVLVTGDVFGDMYVIGLLTVNKSHKKKLRPEKFEISNGAYAMLDETSTSPAFKLFSRRNELLIEYDPESEKARINIDSGDLEFMTHNGDIIFSSANNIQLKGQNIELAGRSGIRLGVIDTIGQLASSFSLRSCKTSLSCAKLAITAQLGEFQLKETRFVSSKFLGKIEDSQLIVGKLAIIANTITEKAKNVYKTVEQLTQLKTGRMRTLVDSTFHMKAKKTFMKSQEDFKVNAEKIHLG
ncbi:MAG: DUF3540 domain-containing protein [Desulfobacterales bacterium]|nr:DUF3540 domain-containing protein [Desulfobacterales bacterium]